MMFGHPTNLYWYKAFMEIDVKPFKSIGNPGTSSFELDTDIAFVLIFSYFTAAAVIVKRGCVDATWQTLASLWHESTLNLPPRLAGFTFANLCDETLGLDIAVGKLDTVVVAISYRCVKMAEHLDLHTELTLWSTYHTILRND